MTFEGEVAIGLKITQPIGSITLHASKNIIFDIENCFVIQNNSEVSVESITASDEYEQVIIHLSQKINENIPTTLVLAYNSSIISLTRGIFLSEYENKNGYKKFALLTKFEPNSARYVIPCFDEPQLKATWTTTLVHPQGTTALSNTATVDVEKIGNNMTLTNFETTPIMSSYLLAFVVSDFEYKTAITSSGISVRVFAPPKHFHSIDFALNAAVKSLEFFENMLGINYRLSKIDLIGFKKFPSGAMENWGLITFGEHALYSENAFVIEIVAHEIAHQWFGNLVTASWWDEIWLNEGFASFYANFGIENVTEGNISFVEMIGDNAGYYLDQHRTGIYHEQPTTKPIDTLESFGLAFDPFTTYTKASVILNMFRNVIGNTIFDEKIRNYLIGQSYSNANSSIFYSYFEMPAGGPSSVSEFLQPWFNQVGHPLITVNSYNSTHNILTQSRFDNNKLKELDESVKYPEWGYKWDIPVWCSTSDNAYDMVWLLQNSSAYVPRNVTINPTREGIYKVMYNNTSEKFNSEKWQALESIAKMTSKV